MQKLIKQGEKLFFGDKRILLVHLEFTSVCNRHCSYCLEGNGFPDKIKEEFSDETAMLNAIDKIFNVANDNDFIGFIIVGGEPTLQPSLKTVINKIQSRKDTGIMLTTNFTQSVNYYKELDIPLIVSVHMEDNNILEVIEKIKQLNHLIVHVRFMALPEMFELAKLIYNDLLLLNNIIPLNLTISAVFAHGIYKPNYTQEYLDWIQNTLPIVNDYPESLNEKLKLLKNLFFHLTWWYKEGDNITEVGGGLPYYKGFYCERNLISIEKNGKIHQCWCNDPGINIFTVDELPKDIFSTVICDKQECVMGYVSTFPKFKSMEYAPEYLKN